MFFVVIFHLFYVLVQNLFCICGGTKRECNTRKNSLSLATNWRETYSLNNNMHPLQSSLHWFYRKFQKTGRKNP